jgi:uncharacterized protein YxjI
VDGKAFSLGNQLSFQDMAGNELAFIRQKMLEFKPIYEISRDGQPLAIVEKELLTFSKCKFEIDATRGKDLLVEGDFLSHQYVFADDKGPVAEVSKKWFTLADTYGVQISPSQDDVLILASTVVIDMVCHGDQRQ